MKLTDVRIEAVEHQYEDYLYRTPIKFGGKVLDRVTLLNVKCMVRTVGGKSAHGFGSMPLGNVWSFPSRVLSYDATLGAMKALAERIGRIIGGCTEVGHPIDLALALEPEYPQGGGRGHGGTAAGGADPAALHAGRRQRLRRRRARRLRQGPRPQLLSHLRTRLPVPRPRPLPRRRVRRRIAGTVPRADAAAADAAVSPDRRPGPDREYQISFKGVDDGLPETLPEWIRATTA